MPNNYATAESIRADAQDLAVLGRSPTNPDLFVYAVKPSLETQQELYNLSIADARESNIPAFQRHWKMGKTGIEGSSILLNTRFDQKVLRPLEMWIPGFLEAKALEAQEKLENGFYRDYGGVLCTPEYPNKEIAEVLARGRNDLPLIIPFRALSYIIDEEISTGIRPSIVENPQGIISGKKAQEEIAKFSHKSKSGFCGMGYDGRGMFFRYWDASWERLDSSDALGRVDWVCGEATAQDLKDARARIQDKIIQNTILIFPQEIRLL